MEERRYSRKLRCVIFICYFMCLVNFRRDGHPRPEPIQPVASSMSQYFYRPEDCSHHNIFPGVDIHTVAGDRLMVSLVEFQPNSVVQPHSHPHEQMGLLLEGELTFVVGEQRQTLRAGEMWRIPGGVVHSVYAGEQPAKALDVFHPVRDDYR